MNEAHKNNNSIETIKIDFTEELEKPLAMLLLVKFITN